jgi:putative FmdB family regulatory protein
MRRGYHRPVPIYEFSCPSCGARFEDLVPAGTEERECSECGAGHATRVYSTVGAVPRLLKTPREARRQERRNAQLRASTKARFKAARARMRGERDPGRGG